MNTLFFKNIASPRLHLLAWLSLLAGAFPLAAPQAAETTPERSLATLASFRPPTGEWMPVSQVALDPGTPSKLLWQSGEGVLLNGAAGKTADLLTRDEYGDVTVHVEFCIPKGSNSGIYLMGRYEVQIYDSFSVAKDKYPGIECGGIYPRWTAERAEFEGHSPMKNVSRAPGDWQSFDITFRAPRFDASGKKVANARFITVVHNGTVVHENVDVTGPTRAAHWEEEAAKGPLLIQGDHGPVAIRNLTLTVRAE